jgi:hypothetical protein
LDYREQLLACLRGRRDDIAYRIGFFEEGRRIVERRDGREVDITAEVLARLHVQLGEVGALIHDTVKPAPPGPGRTH